MSFGGAGGAGVLNGGVLGCVLGGPLVVFSCSDGAGGGDLGCVFVVFWWCFRVRRFG